MQSSQAIGLIVHEPHSLFVEDPNIASILLGANSALSEADYQLSCLIADTPRDVDRLARYLSGGLIDGVIIVSARVGDPITRAASSWDARRVRRQPARHRRRRARRDRQPRFGARDHETTSARAGAASAWSPRLSTATPAPIASPGSSTPSAATSNRSSSSGCRSTRSPTARRDGASARPRPRHRRRLRLERRRRRRRDRSPPRGGSERPRRRGDRRLRRQLLGLRCDPHCRPCTNPPTSSAAPPPAPSSLSSTDRPSPPRSCGQPDRLARVGLNARNRPGSPPGTVRRRQRVSAISLGVTFSVALVSTSPW